MSIFKATFKEGVCNQLKVRQKAINNRTPGNLTYYNSRNAWIRMTSAVEVNGDKGALANKYVLKGGILDPNKNLRSGIGVDGAYNNASPGYGTEYRLGIRPMPGITSIDVKSKAAYGSLREVTVSFVCWDIHQLEELELLYMRPGYSAMVEWGWSPYLKNNEALETNVSFVNDVLDAQDGKPSKEDIWKKTFEKASSDTDGGNYDAEYGRIQNYSWKARMDGGYDCTTTLISWGEILESLKVNYGAYKTDVGQNSNFKDPNIKVPFDKDSNISKSYAKNKLAGVINEMYLIARGGFGGSYDSGASGGLVNTVTNALEATGDAIVSAAETIVNTVTSVVTGEEASVFSADVKSQAITLDGESYEFALFEIDIANNASQLKDSDFEGSKQIYITLEGFVKILNKNIVLQDTANKNALVEISTTEGDHMEHPGNPLLCLGDKLQLSTNPSVCLIKNTAWSNPADLGFDEGFSDDFSTLVKVMDTLTKNYWYNDTYVDTQFGVIQNIYVNLAYLYSLVVNEDLAAQDKKEKNDISLFDFLKNMMNGINTSIGNVANFDVFVDPQDSKARIIDVNYVDATKRNDAFEKACVIQLHNLNSTARSYSFESQIFPEQSSMIAIGAQVKGGALGDKVDTLVDYNQKLIDRVVPAKDAPLPQNQVADAAKEKEDALTNLKENVDILVKYINQIDADWYEVIGDFDVSESGKYSNALKDIISYFKSLYKDDNKNRAIIPTKLSIELDGIGGIVIGNLFRIPEELMPRGYKGDGAGPAKLGYCVTGLGHTISGNDWKTKIDAQFIILDEPRGTATTADLAAIKTIIKASKEVEKDPKKAVKKVDKAVEETKKAIINNNAAASAGGSGYASSPVGVYYLKTQGYTNGNIPDSELVYLNTSDKTSNKMHRLHPTAAKQWEALYAAAKAAGFKFNVSYVGGAAYRPRSSQKSGPGHATPGSSPHGLGGAVDIQQLYTLQGGIKNLGAKAHKKVRDNSTLWQWLEANGPAYGWYNPSRLRNGGGAESWHYEYWGQLNASVPSALSERQKNINTVYCGLVNNIVQSGSTYYKGKTWDVFKSEQKVTAEEENIAKQSCNKTSKVDAIFIGGLESLSYNGVLMTQAEQLKLFKKTYGANKNVAEFKHNAATSSILAVLKENPKIPVVMFSKGCDIANIIAADSNADKNKIYIIEPWAKNGNAAVSDAVKKGVPANHVYVGATAETGKGVVAGASSSNALKHFDALTNIAPLVK
jgi:hypothetical protein